ncbi:MAG: hypothetical protein JSU68_13625, partial [Phycisphaerales bacterium]
ILVLLWRKASYAGCVAGMITGFAVALAWPEIWTAQREAATGIHIYNLPLAFVCALVVNTVVSHILPGSGEGRSPRGFPVA